MSGDPRKIDRATTPGGLEGPVARLLRIGTYSAVAFIAVGVVLMLASGRTPLDVAPALDPGRIAADLIALHPAGFLWLGVLLVMMTPAARVVVSIIGFARTGEREMVIAGVLVLGVVLLGIAVGPTGG